MEKYISKLQEVKDQLKLSDNVLASFDRNRFHLLIGRVIALMDKKYGNDNIFSQRLDKLKNDTWLSVRESELENFKLLIDIIIDDIELSEKKEEAIITPVLEEKKNKEIAQEIQLLNNNIFIVHGHNEAMKQSVARVIEKLDLKPIILHEQANLGQTIIEKIWSHSSVGFAIVLLSADDIGYSIREGDKKAKKRTRQNVIFELGYFTARLGRKRVVALVEDINNFELPSDFYGIIYISYDGDNGKWKFEVVRELKEIGYDVDVNKIL